jgi:hypothetical protein
MQGLGTRAQLSCQWNSAASPPPHSRGNRVSARSETVVRVTESRGTCLWVNKRPKRVTHFSIILARSKGRIAWLQRKVLVAIGAVAATIPIVAFQQAPVSRQSRVPRVGHVRAQPQHQREGQ